MPQIVLFSPTKMSSYSLFFILFSFTRTTRSLPPEMDKRDEEGLILFQKLPKRCIRVMGVYVSR